MRGPSLATLLMPCLQNRRPVSHNHTANRIQFPSAKTIVIRQSERLKPKLACVVIAFHVDVRGLVAIEAHEEKPVWPRNITDSRHPSCSNTTSHLHIEDTLTSYLKECPLPAKLPSEYSSVSTAVD